MKRAHGTRFLPALVGTWLLGATVGLLPAAEKAAQVGPALEDLAHLWVGFGGPCETGSSAELAVRFDEPSRSWRIGKDVGDLHCVAVSVTEDATGRYDRYVFAGNDAPTQLAPPGCDATCVKRMLNAANNTRGRVSNQRFTLMPAPPARCVGPHAGASCLSDRACDSSPAARDGNCTSTGASFQPIPSPTLHLLTWDPLLATAAQDRSDLCDLQPDPANQANGWGENIAGAPGGALALPSAVVARWEHQANFYTYGPVAAPHACSAGNPSCPVNQTCDPELLTCVPDTAEYTQLVWADTATLGCGHTLCPPTTGPFAREWDYWVCKFAPAGNVLGSAPYTLPSAGCTSNAACNDGNPCTDDACTSSACTHTNNATPCDDGIDCTAPDACAAGHCVSGPNTCTGCADDFDCDDTNPCTDDTCVNPGTFNALCNHASNTAPCDDGNVCTGPDACSGGLCLAGQAICTGCVSNAACDDDNPCTDDICTNPGAPGAICTYVAVAGDCNDGLFCNGSDTCVSGVCTHTGDPCVGGTECNATCQEATQTCFAPTTTHCTPDTSACTFDLCDGAGACGHPNKPAGSTCDDGNPCTTNDACNGPGQCVGGAPRTCDDNNPCTTDSCDPASGCRNVPSSGPRPAVYFSPTTSQFLAGSTAKDVDLYRSDTCGLGIGRAVPAFVPDELGVDAFDVRGDGNIVFSVRTSGAVRHSAGLVQTKAENVYLFEVATGAVRTVIDWQALGISMENIDAIDQLQDGTFAFSTTALRGVTHAGGFTQLRPQNVYRFNPATRTITLLLDGQALGLADLDGVDVYPDGRVAFSTKTNGIVRGVSVKQQNAYTLEQNGGLTLSLDGERIGITSLDGFTLEVAME